MPPKKEEKPATDHFPSVVLFLCVLGFLYLLEVRVQWYLENTALGSYHSIWAHITAFVLLHVWPAIKILAAIVVGGSIIGIVYIVSQLRAINKEEAAVYHDAEDKGAEAPSIQKNERWEKVLVHINSTNSSDWRLAIIEADIMLDDLLEACGYHGASIGDKLKAVEPSDFLTLNNAWEAHKVRNEIAHAGSDFELAERDARRVIVLYESVFKEFKMI